MPLESCHSIPIILSPPIPDVLACEKRAKKVKKKQKTKISLYIKLKPTWPLKIRITIMTDEPEVGKVLDEIDEGKTPFFG